MKRNGLYGGDWEHHHTLALDEEKYVSARACSISEKNESAYINAVNELGYCDHYAKSGVFMRTPTPLAEKYMLLYVQLWGVPMLALIDTGSEVNLISAEHFLISGGVVSLRGTKFVRYIPYWIQLIIDHFI